MDLNKVEAKWQNIWEKERIFEPKVDSKNKKFFLTVPYPYTSGPLHVGHGRTYCVADFIARFKRKQGFNVLWPMAFHISGTPILSISDRIKRGDEKYVELFKSYISLYENNPEKIERIIKSFENPQRIADYFASVISNDFKSIGLSIDWTRKFNTGEAEYNKFVEWQFEKLMNNKALVKGSHPVTYCMKCENAAGEDDIKDGDTDKVKVNEYTTVKFRMGDKFLAASTLRPETIYGVTNLWVNPKDRYVEAELGRDVIIISREGFEKLKYQAKPKLLREVSGKELLGLKAEAPTGKEVMVLPGSFVDADTATGVVYSVPAHAPFDYIALKELQESDEMIKEYNLDAAIVKSIKPVIIIDVSSYKGEPAIEAVKKFHITSLNQHDLIEEATKEVYKEEFYNGVLNNRCGEFKGMHVKDIKDKVKDYLKKEGKAFTFYDTSRKADCRCGGKVLIAVLENQWFLDYSSKEWKKDSERLINEMMIYPDKYRKQFIDVIEWLDKRPCARRRGLGTHLPYDKEWMIESLSDSTIYMAFYLIIDTIRAHEIKPNKLTPEFFDYVLLGKGKAESVSKNTGIKLELINEMRSNFTYWYPVDERHTAPAHISNHLAFFIMHHTSIFPKKYWPKAMTFNELLIREGAKMSKSKGNVIPLIDISRKYSADLFRLYLLSNSDLDAVADWKDKDVSNTRGKLNSFIKVAEAAISAKPADTLNTLDEWVTARFYSRLKEAYKQGESLGIRGYAINIFFEFLNELGYYSQKVGEEQSSRVIRLFLKDWLVSLEPLIPHTCEELWSRFNKGFVSMQNFAKFDDKRLKGLKKSEDKIELLKSVSYDITKIIELIGKKPAKITIIVSPAWKYSFYNEFKKAYESKKDAKELINHFMKIEEYKKNSKSVINLIGSLIKDPGKMPKIISSQKEEYETLSDDKRFFSGEFNCSVEVMKAEDSSNPKAQSAGPTKPGIIIE